jgi:hypothetical protein
MSTFPVLLILGGLALMGFGLLLFYSWLPLFYGLIGFDSGLLLGRLLGDDRWITIFLALICAVLFVAAAYSASRRLLLGVAAGILVGFALASALNLVGKDAGIVALVLAFLGGVLGRYVPPKYFDRFIIGASAFSGAVLVTEGLRLLVFNGGLLDRAFGGYFPTLVLIALTAIGISWQYRNLVEWVSLEPKLGSISGSSVKESVDNGRPSTRSGRR